jgi:pSer/pThr/pTyr-binding forkhead associated (FHA) protein
MRLGKETDCDINFCNSGDFTKFKTISMNHAQIKPSKLEDTHKPSWGKNRFLAIWDDTSSNGTLINGTLVKKGTSRELHEGDRLKLGKEHETLHFIFVRSLTPVPCVASVCVSLTSCC